MELRCSPSTWRLQKMHTWRSIAALHSRPAGHSLIPFLCEACPFISAQHLGLEGFIPAHCFTDEMVKHLVPNLKSAATCICKTKHLVFLYLLDKLKLNTLCADLSALLCCMLKTWSYPEPWPTLGMTSQQSDKEVVKTVWINDDLYLCMHLMTESLSLTLLQWSDNLFHRLFLIAWHLFNMPKWLNRNRIEKKRVHEWKNIVFFQDDTANHTG